VLSDTRCPAACGFFPLLSPFPFVPFCFFLHLLLWSEGESRLGPQLPSFRSCIRFSTPCPSGFILSFRSFFQLVPFTLTLLPVSPLTLRRHSCRTRSIHQEPLTIDSGKMLSLKHTGFALWSTLLFVLLVPCGAVADHLNRMGHQSRSTFQRRDLVIETLDGSILDRAPTPALVHKLPF